MGKSIKLFVGMDVHKDSMDGATGDERGGEVRHYGAMGGDLAAVTRLARKLESAGGLPDGVLRPGALRTLLRPAPPAGLAITKAGNSSARRALVEAAWAYRYGARVSPIQSRGARAGWRTP